MDMKAIGVFGTVLFALGLGAVAWIAIGSVPELKRYLKMEAM
jgi:hypothetical protein